MIAEVVIRYASEKHEGQRRKDNSPYIYHPLTVMLNLRNKGYDINYQMAGLCHDLLEDTDATEEEILALTNAEVLEAVKLLTKVEGYDPKEYIESILKNPIAKAVKNEDRIHNLKESVKADLKFQVKYLKETEAWYLGRFSDELDNEYHKLEARIG